MVSENAIRRFLRAVWDKAQHTGWPVNAYQIGSSIFGGDEQVARQSTQSVIAECERRRYFKATQEGDIHTLSASAKALLGIKG